MILSYLNAVQCCLPEVLCIFGSFPYPHQWVILKFIKVFCILILKFGNNVNVALLYHLIKSLMLSLLSYRVVYLKIENVHDFKIIILYGF